MATTSPDNIWTPDSGDDYALTVDLAAMADTVQDAITANKFALVGLDSERPANGSPGLVEGMTWYSTDTQVEWRYQSTQWVRSINLGVPYGRLWRDSGQAVADTGGNVQITYPTGSKLRGGVSVESNGLKVPLAGTYEINVVNTYDVSNTGRRDAMFAVNGTVNEQYHYVGVASAAVGFLAATRAEVELNANDVVTALARQTSGAPRNVTGLLSVRFITA